MVEILHFDKTILKSLETHRYYEREQKKYREEQKTWVSDGSGSLGPGYSAWMCGRRMGDYRYFYELQIGLIHQVAFGGSYTVCSCGLSLDGKLEASDLRKTFGHIDAETKEVQSIFIFNTKIICQGCGELGEVDVEGDVKVCAEAVLRARAEHKCSFEISDDMRAKVAQLVAKPR